jgi:hypothetical protein
MNHLRPANLASPALRHAAPLARIGGAFDEIPRTVDVRRIATGAGRYNIPNVGIFLWPLEARSLHRSPAVALDARRFLLDPLGAPVQLVRRPEREDDVAHLAEPRNVPGAISRRTLAAEMAELYSPGRSLEVFVDGVALAAAEIDVCDLRDFGAGWAHVPTEGKVAIDPGLGRLALPGDPGATADVRVTYHYAFPADLGAGEYDRGAGFESPSGTRVAVPSQQPTIQAALDALAGSGVVEIEDGGRYVEDLDVAVAAGATIELRAADRTAPTLIATRPIAAVGGAGATLVLNGLRVAGAGIAVAAGAGNALGALRVRHCTLAPVASVSSGGTGVAACQPAIAIALDGCELEVSRSIVGALRVAEGAVAVLSDAIVDAGATDAVAFSADGVASGGILRAAAITVIGEVRARSLHASNAIFASPVRIARRQEGCVRFSFVAPESLTPRRHRCQPESAAGAFPSFLSLRFGADGYAELAPRTPLAIRSGADDDSEMGAFHLVYAPQRISDLRTRLAEFLPVGLQAGIFLERR